MPLDIFAKTKLPESLSDEMQAIVDDLKKSSNKEECLRHAYEILDKKYRGWRVKTWARVWEVFEKDAEKMWAMEGFLHCTNMNYLLRILLVGSGFFKDEDICLVWTQIWYVSPHQYMKVRIVGRWVNIDIWAHAYGTQFGRYASGFCKNKA